MTEDSSHPSLRACLLLVVFSFLLSILFTLLSASLFPGVELLLGELFFVLPLLAYLKVNKFDLVASFRVNKIDRQVIIASICLSIGAVVLVDELDRLVATFIDVPPELQELLAERLTIDSISDAALILLGAVLFAGVFEEMIFRGVLQQAFERRLQLPHALFSTALIFAFLHLFSPWIIQILMLGLLLGYLSWRSDSILPGVILHCLNNAFALLLLNVTADSIAWYNWNGHVNPPILIAASGIVFYSVKWFHRLTEFESAGA